MKPIAKYYDAFNWCHLNSRCRHSGIFSDWHRFKGWLLIVSRHTSVNKREILFQQLCYRFHFPERFVDDSHFSIFPFLRVLCSQNLDQRVPSTRYSQTGLYCGIKPQLMKGVSTAAPERHCCNTCRSAGVAWAQVAQSTACAPSSAVSYPCSSLWSC